MKEKLQKYKKKLIVLAIILVLVVAIMVTRSNMSKKQHEMMQAMNKTETAAVEKRTLMSSVSATGSITSAESKEISVSLSNTEVESVNVKLGDIIEAGTVLCTFNSEDIEESLAEAKASLNVTTTKTQMDVASAERSLAEAVESSNIETARINDDVADALSDYEEALDDVDDMEDDLEDAEDLADSLEDKIEQYNTNKSKYTKQQKSAENDFNTAKEELLNYIVNNPDNCKDTARSAAEGIALETTLSLATGDIVIDGGDTTKVDALIATLQSSQETYTNAGEKLSKLGDLTSIQKEYEAAVQNAEALEKSYEQAVSTADSKYDAYEQKLRSQEDTARSNESTIANKTDSVTTSKLNATTSGTGDKNQIEQYEEQLENCTVTSPISGIVTAINIEVGDNYSGSAIATIEDISSYKITTEIDEYDIVNIEAGQKVVIKTNGTGDMELEGTVETVAPRATSAAGNSSDVTYTVTITVDTPCDDLKLDMTAKLSIVLESKENVLTVPYNAVQEDEDGNYYVEVVSESNMPVGEVPQMLSGMPGHGGNRGENDGMNGAASKLQTTRIYITKGIESDYYIEVISDEITEGMQVVVPQTEDTQSIQNMMMNRGPMGGF